VHDVGARLGQQQRGQRPGDVVAEIHDADAAEPAGWLAHLS
jgi:hypothetical protein